jgi:predicted DNA-binding protein YlxM (UPF0122 family)
MNAIPVSPAIWDLAKAILTQKQMTVLTLREKHGYSWNQLAITLNTVRSNVREHHRAASKNLLDAIEAAGSIEAALERVHAKQQLDWMDEMERTEQEVFPDSRPRSEVIVELDPRPSSGGQPKQGRT